MMVPDLLLGLAALPFLAAATYLAVLALLARPTPPPPGTVPTIRFDVIIPAHNEETGIGETIQSLQSVHYPAALRRILVVADNCTDGTADRAAAAGALVMVRKDPNQRGKGYALAHAFAESLADGFADVIVVVDADTLVSGNLLLAFAARFASGASVVQADYGVRNQRASWRTRLMTIALAAFHGVRSIARERLGYSCGLRGNGMGFRKDVLAAHPPRAFSIVEDLEYGIHLGYAGIRVEYVHEARVLGHMAITERASRSQRRRWERGRQALVSAHFRSLVREAWRRRSPWLLDLAIDLIVPPIGNLVAIVAGGLAVSLLAATQFGATTAPWLWAAAFAAIATHVVKAWSISGVGPRGLLDLLWAPVYVIWKVTLRFGDRGRTPEEWVRTKREVHS
jgi:cellulose synthase/poly-beta-1,6-N-acetylglucosamine synthase-like glycosyltransferase